MTRPAPKADAPPWEWFLWNLLVAFMASLLTFALFHVVFDDTRAPGTLRAVIGSPIIFVLAGGHLITMALWLGGSAIIFLLAAAGTRRRLVLRVLIVPVPAAFALISAEDRWMASYWVGTVIAFALVVRLPRATP